MVTRVSLNTFTVSRRTTLQMGLAAAIAGELVGRPKRVAAQDASTATWNWGGNAGHTGELPGPGLDLNSALGELWRIPKQSFGDSAVAGYGNGVVYTRNGESLWAIRLSDGAFLWAQGPTKLAGQLAATPSPEAEAEEIGFSDRIAIDGDIVLVRLNNGHLLALDAATGELRWDFDSASASISLPTVVDHVAYFHSGEVIYAIELGEQPTLRWQAEVGGAILGIENGLMYVAATNSSSGGATEVRALTVQDGSEFWRTSTPDNNRIAEVYGVHQGGVLLLSYDDEFDIPRLVMVNRDGQIAWSAGIENYGWDYVWILNDTITQLTSTQLQALYAESGRPSWTLELTTGRWWPIGEEPVLCTGKAYALINDSYQESNVLVVVDPSSGEVFGAWDSLAIPLFVADGVMLAQDDDTGDIVAIGPVPAVLQAGGRATVTQDATLRGAPSDSAIERGQLISGTLVDVTGDSETSNGTEWAPVIEPETGNSGWLPVDVLAGQTGSVRFSPIELYEFGNYTSTPKFTSGTKAEIIEEAALRGAPSDTSAEKATLEVGTLVTVTSPPTKDGETEWCPIMVDATGVSGWVPTSVLKLVPGA